MKTAFQILNWNNQKCKLKHHFMFTRPATIFRTSNMTLAGKVVRVPKKSPPQKKNPFSQSVEGSRRGCFRSKYKGFPNFLLFPLRFQCFSNLLSHCQIKTPSVQTFHWRNWERGGGLFPNHLSGERHIQNICLKKQLLVKNAKLSTSLHVHYRGIFRFAVVDQNCDRDDIFFQNQS